jgi:hypothetical protein
VLQYVLLRKISRIGVLYGNTIMALLLDGVVLELGVYENRILGDI